MLTKTPSFVDLTFLRSIGIKQSVLLFYFFLNFYSFCFSQNQKLDSLQNLLTHSQEDSTKVNVLYQISEICYEEDVLKYAGKAFELAVKINYKKGIADAANNIGFFYNNSGKPLEALMYYKKALDIRVLINDKKGIAGSLNNIGVVYNNQGQIQKALEYSLESLRMREELNDKEETAYSLSNIGVIYTQQSQYDEALNYLQRALKMSQDIGDKIGIASCLNNLSTLYDHLGQHEKALQYSLSSFKLYEDINDKDGMANALNLMGQIHILNAEPEKGLAYCLRSLRIYEEINDQQGVAMALNNIGDFYLKKWNLEKLDKEKRKLLKQAENYCLLSLKTAKELGYPENIRSASGKLSMIYAGEGKYKEAFENQVLFKKMSDIASNKETQKVAMQYEFAKKESETKLIQEKKDALTLEEKQKREIIIYSVSAGFLLMLFLAGFIYKGYKEKKHSNTEIAEQKRIIEEKQKDILDSIRYAKRIQQSLLTSEKYINRVLSKIKDSNDG